MVDPCIGIVFPLLSPEQLAARWRELLDNPPGECRFELDAYGDVVMMPVPKTAHQRAVMVLCFQIKDQLQGEPLPGVGVLTNCGVFVPDVVWNPKFSHQDPQSPAPQLCIEVQSESDTRRSIDEKLCAYLSAGSREVALVELGGRLRFFGPEGTRSKSTFGLKLTMPEGPYRQ